MYSRVESEIYEAGLGLGWAQGLFCLQGYGHPSPGLLCSLEDRDKLVLAEWGGGSGPALSSCRSPPLPPTPFPQASDTQIHFWSMYLPVVPHTVWPPVHQSLLLLFIAKELSSTWMDYAMCLLFIDVPDFWTL